MSRRVAVISDVHGNWHALEAVFAALDGKRPDAVWCLGDTVGYGPQPNRCCSAVAGHADRTLAGNHDLGVLGTVDLDDFSPDAAAAALYTRGALEDEARDFLSGLRPTGEEEGVELFHASPRDPVWDYVLSYEAGLASLELTTAPLVLVGHSHVPLALRLEDGRIEGGVATAGSDVDLATGRWLLNPGSVGQPRDSDPRAAFLLLEPGLRATFHRVPYAIEETQAEIRRAGLPESLAERLTRGV